MKTHATMTSMLSRLSHSPLDQAHRVSRFVLSAALFAISAPAAYSQWSVVDREANGKLDTTNDKLETANDELRDANRVLGARQEANDATINRNIYNLNQRLNLDSSKSPGNRVEDPKQSWTTQQLTQGIERCDQVASSQKALCEELVKTRNAHYMYMKTMYDNTDTRDQRLTELVDQRSQLTADDYGKLQDNTNQIVTLQTLIALDRQQMESVNHAFQARIDYLNAQLSHQANTTTSGQSTGSIIGSVIGSVVGGVALKTALNLVQHSSAPGRRKLSIDQ